MSQGDLGGLPGLIEQGKDVIGGIGEAASFASDPAGYVFDKLREGAAGLTGDLLPYLNGLTKPKLDAPWFIDAYRISFGFAMVVLAVLILVMGIGLARRSLSGAEFVNSMMVYLPIVVFCSTFGPSIGMLLVSVFGSISDGLASWGFNGSTDEVFTSLEARIDDADPAGFVGGVFVGIIIMLGMIAAVIGVIIIYIVQLAALYFSGLLFTLAIIWVVNPKTRKFGARGAMVFLGILVAHTLLWLMLAFAFRAIPGLALSWTKPGGTSNPLETTVSLATVVVLLGLAVFAPAGLTAIGKMVTPGIAGMGGSGIPPAPGGSNGSPGNGQGQRVGDSADAGGGDSTGDVQGAVDDGAGSAPSGGGASSGGGGGASDGAGTSGTTSAPAGAAEGGDSATGAASKATSGADATSSMASSGAAGAGPSEGAAAAVSGGGGAAEGAVAAGAGGAEGLAAVGAAESATGAGAAIGVPTLMFAAAVGAAQKGSQLANVAANQAVEASNYQES